MGNYRWGYTTVESCKTLSLKRLREWGFIEPNCYQSTAITFYTGKEETGSMRIWISTLSNDAYVQLKYYFEEKEGNRYIDYKIPLVKVPSNLGKGFRYYFLCPVTGKKCVKLYRPPREDYFLHREAFKGLRYEQQIKSKKSRSFWSGPIGLLFKKEELLEKVVNKPKYAKLYYRGKPTPRLRRYLEVQEKSSRYSRADYERILERSF